MRLYIHKKKPFVRQLQALARLVPEAKDASSLALLLRKFLEIKPNAFEIRYFLRTIQMEIFDSKEYLALKDRWQQLKLPVLLAKAHHALKENPVQAMELAEDVLMINPYDQGGNEVLAQAATKQGYHYLSAMAYETILQQKPEDLHFLQCLSQAYISAQRFDEAGEVYHEMQKIDPDDPGLIEGLEKLDRARENYHKGEGNTDEEEPLIHRPQPSQWELESEFHPQAKKTKANRLLRYELRAVLDPFHSGSNPLKELEAIYEPLEAQCADNADQLLEWQQNMETTHKDYRDKLRIALTGAPDNPELNLQLGLIEATLLYFSEAKRYFKKASHSEPLHHLAHSLIFLCLCHNEIIVRPTSGPSRADFAWIV